MNIIEIVSTKNAKYFAEQFFLLNYIGTH